MKSKSLRNALFVGSAMFFAAAGSVTMMVKPVHADTTAKPSQSAGEMIDDTVITSKVKAAFVRDDQVSALRINVTSDNGVVQLSGFANSAQEAERAAEVARKIPGVKDVKNDIELKRKP